MAKKGYHDERRTTWAGQISYEYWSHDADGNMIAGRTVDAFMKYVVELLRALVDNGLCDFVVYIKHDRDRDLKNGGILKGLHIHFIVHCVKSPKDGRFTQNSGMQYFGITRSKDFEPVKNNAGAFQYLIHVSTSALRERKTIYDFSEIQHFTSLQDFDLMSYFYPSSKKNKSEKGKVDMFHHSVITGAMTVSEVEKEYIADDELGASKWASARRLYQNDELEWMKHVCDWYSTHPACKTAIFITGGGGAKKTRLAQGVLGAYYADKRGIHIAPAAQRKITYDPCGKYNGQRVSVLKEIRGSYWTVEGFCDAFDPTSAGYVGSRNVDKAFFPEVILLTTSDTIEDFISGMMRKHIRGVDDSGYSLREAYNPSKNHFEPYIEYIESFGRTAEIKFDDTAGAEIWDKAWQIRRRIPIIIELDDVKEVARISYLKYSERTNWFKVKSDSNGREPHPYEHYATVPYSITDDAIAKNLICTVNDAVNTYYAVNKHGTTPSTVERPVIQI